MTLLTRIQDTSERLTASDRRIIEVLLGQQEGPRFGQFIALYGVAETIALIEQALARVPTEAAG